MMTNKVTCLQRLGLIAVLAMAAAVSAAAPPEAQIKIDRATDSPTLVIKYSGAAATLVEFRLNGETISTRAVSGAKDAGETNFSLDPTLLRDGDNEVEIRLFDRAGHLLGRDRVIIQADQSAGGPVYLAAPKMGATVMGAVEIRMGFGEELKNTYVSFFVDSEFRSMLNIPPFVWAWDTRKESNGWHEVEAWAVDETNTTFKTKRARVFVNNPGGRTDRQGVVGIDELVPLKNSSRGTVVGTDKGLKVRPSAGGKMVTRAPQGLPPVLSPNAVANKINVRGDGQAAGLKPLQTPVAVAMGAKDLAPTGRRDVVVTVARPAVKSAASVGTKEVATKPRVSPSLTVSKAPVVATPEPAFALSTHRTPRLAISAGTRLDAVGAFSVSYGGSMIDFDVAPRIVEGVPMSPFRHLIERAGGKVKWNNAAKSVSADAEGRAITFQIGSMLASVGGMKLTMDRAPFLESGRSIVPVSFFRSALSVDVEYDRESGHVLITAKK